MVALLVWPPGDSSRAVVVLILWITRPLLTMKALCACTPYAALLHTPVPGGDIYKALVLTEDSDIITSISMVAVTAFKWQAFGNARWQSDLVRYANYAGSFIIGAYILHRIPEFWVLGLGFLGVAMAINLWYIYEETVQLRGEGVAAYTRSLYNLADLALLAGITGQLVLNATLGATGLSRLIASLVRHPGGSDGTEAVGVGVLGQWLRIARGEVEGAL